MEHIDIFQDGKSISKVVIGDGLKADGDLGRCLKPYRHVFAVADEQVVLKSRPVNALLQSLSAAGVPVKKIEAAEGEDTSKA